MYYYVIEVGRDVKFQSYIYLVALLWCFFGLSNAGFAQQNLRHKTLKIDRDTVHIDSLVMVPGSFQIIGLDQDDYFIDHAQSLFIRRTAETTGSFMVTYRVFPSSLSQTYFNKDTSIYFKPGNAEADPFRYVAEPDLSNNIFGNGLNKTGSISRGINFGNRQNLSVNSNLNLQMSGKIAPDVSVLASVTDDNIPIQPQGNTQQLQDFDQVYIKVFNEDSWELTAGDFWLYKPNGYFMDYKKRAQGGSFTGKLNLTDQDNGPFLKTQASGAISKGKFARNQIQGVEGNQGPYRLTGINNEPFIIVLSGTERVFIDGRLLTRGQENDYVIDYNTSEITFTPKNMITKDRRIIVEFQYSDQNYARSLFQVANQFESKKWSAWLNVYSEQDAKNQPLQIQLNEDQRQILSDAGDNISQAFASSVDTAEFSENRLLYEMRDTIAGTGTYTILVFSINEDSSLYKANFSDVGENNGNYVLDEITAIGRTYRWIEPIGGVPQGDHEPVILLPAPNKRQMVTAGTEFRYNDKSKIGFEGAMSNDDLNTFSSLDAGDNIGTAMKAYWESTIDLSKKSSISFGSEAEYQQSTFKSIERFRAVEFSRNWNVQNVNISSDQWLANANVGFNQSGLGSVRYGFNTFLAGSAYQGFKNDLFVNLGQRDWGVRANGSYLISNGNENTDFIRHKALLFKSFKSIKISYQDEHEYNIREVLSSKSGYQFYDGKFAIGTGDSTKNKFEIYARQRLDKKIDSTGSLARSAIAQQFGGSAHFLKSRAHQLKLNVAYRELRILDTSLINTQPENTLLSRLEHKLKLFKGAISTSTFYEIGSGLELKREFVYVEVQPGQGTHTWIDYNEDGVKNLNEFEIAAFNDQASYIRIFSPTNEYVKTFSNQFSQSVFLKPKQIWRKEKGVKGLLSRFSNQFVFRTNRKTSSSLLEDLYNPFKDAVNDTNLITVSSSLRNTVYFNRTNQKFGMDYGYQKTDGKSLLTSGFDTRSQAYHQIRTRWNLTRKYTFQSDLEFGNKYNLADYVSGRNYDIDYQSYLLRLAFQPNTAFRIALEGTYENKLNTFGSDGEEAKIANGGIDFRYNVIDKGSISGKFNLIYNDYTGEDNTTISYEMLDGLKTGQNMTWNVLYQRSLGKNMQLNLNYTGRKSPDAPTVHTGGVQVRALF